MSQWYNTWCLLPRGESKVVFHLGYIFHELNIIQDWAGGSGWEHDTRLINSVFWNYAEEITGKSNS